MTKNRLPAGLRLQRVRHLEYSGHVQTNVAYTARLFEICQQMNNNNAPALIRAFIIYALCIPLAIWIGFLLADQWTRTTFVYGGILALLFLAPILLRWHHFMLIAGWNFGLTIFFLPGMPPIWLLLTALSFGISVLHRTVNSKAHFLSAPEIARPLLFFLAVVAVTAELTGGIGLHSFGSEVSGGKRYVTLLFGIIGYFAMTAVRIPPKRVGLYVSLFFLGGCSAGIGDLAPYVPSKLYFLFAFFPATGYDMEGKPGMINFHARFAGLGLVGMSCFLFMLARYGVRGIFLSGRPWRCIAFGVFFILIFFGGFRSNVILCSFTFAVQFFMEGMHRSQAMPVFVFIGVIGVTLLIPFAHKLPFTFQRSLAFLPLKLDTAPRMDAESSRDWRLEIWRDTYPQVPQYLLLGKGYAISKQELAIASNQSFAYLSTADVVDTVGNYHSGPLSVLMPFGAWGAIALLWFWFASLRALYAYYRYGDPAFQVINSFLFAYFVIKIFHFLIIFGGLESDLANFAALIGLSVSINGGLRRPAPVPVSVADQTRSSLLARPRFQPFYQR
jgi:O-Antigen ligase